MMKTRVNFTYFYEKLHHPFFPSVRGLSWFRHTKLNKCYPIYVSKNHILDASLISKVVLPLNLLPLDFIQWDTKVRVLDGWTYDESHQDFLETINSFRVGFMPKCELISLICALFFKTIKRM